MKKENRIFIIVLLCLHGIFLFSSALKHSTTFDEIPHLTAGYSCLKLRDYRLNPEHPPLIFLWCSLPLLFQKPVFPSMDQKSWEKSDAWGMGWQFFYNCGNNSRRLLLWGRLMIMILSIGLGLLVYSIAFDLFGAKAGLLSLLLYSFSPTMLAHGNLVTTDLALSLFLLASVYGLWKLFHHVSLKNILFSTFALTGLFTSKFSAVLIIPIYVLMAVWKVIKGPALRIGAKQREIRSPGSQLIVLSSLALFHILAVLFSIWLVYGFRFLPFRSGKIENASYYTIFSLKQGESPWDYLLKNEGISAKCVQTLRSGKILPETYLYGFLFVLSASRERSAFLNGEIRTKGWWYYFPYAFLVKTPLPLFGILLLAVFISLRPGMPLSSEKETDLHTPTGSRGFYHTAPLWILFIVYWAAALKTHLNIGHRHILPIYPVLFIFAGSIAPAWNRIKPGLRWLARVLVFLFIIASLRIFPHDLTYFNILSGGPRNGYRHLVDSNLDWGQDLPALKKYLEKNPPDLKYPFTYLAYFGTGNHEEYGIKAKLLPCFPPRGDGQYFPLSGGRYCISATLFQQLSLLPSSQWIESFERAYQESSALIEEFLNEKKGGGKTRSLVEETGAGFWNELFDLFYKLRMARLCAALREKKPDAFAGYSILIFNLSDDEVRKALVEPPKKVAPDPDFMTLDPRKRFYSPKARFHYFKGLVFIDKKDYDEAVKEFQKSLAIEPEAMDVKEALENLIREKNK